VLPSDHHPDGDRRTRAGRSRTSAPALLPLWPAMSSVQSEYLHNDSVRSDSSADSDSSVSSRDNRHLDTHPVYHSSPDRKRIVSHLRQAQQQVGSLVSSSTL